MKVYLTIFTQCFLFYVLIVLPFKGSLFFYPWINIFLMCTSRKYPYSPCRRDWNWNVRPKNLKKCVKLNLNYQRGGGGMDICWNYTLKLDILRICNSESSQAIIITNFHIFIFIFSFKTRILCW